VRDRLMPTGIAALMTASLLLSSQAVGETSSWAGRVDGPAESVPKKEPPPKSPWGPVKTIKTVPNTRAQMPAITPPIAASGNASEYSKAQPPSDDAAYEAFDQGKYLTALDLAQKAAQKGDPQAHTLIGRIYAEGNGVPQNAALAAQWYARAAELGDTEGTFAYGVMLAKGEGIAKNFDVAAQMFEAAASRKHALANYNLALLFLKGEGKPENPYRAFAHMLFAAESGVAAAQYDLGTLYATGTGVDPNAFEAAKWIGKAAAAGYTEAQVEYAVILFRGHGVPPDSKRGAQLFRAAADKGVAVAQNRLARCYANGAGVETNLVEAAKWHLIAKAGGETDDNLDKVLAKLSKADRAKAQKTADDWRDRRQVGIE
jgi:TPR repeat protein